MSTIDWHKTWNRLVIRLATAAQGALLVTEGIRRHLWTSGQPEDGLCSGLELEDTASEFSSAEQRNWSRLNQECSTDRITFRQGVSDCPGDTHWPGGQRRPGNPRQDNRRLWCTARHPRDSHHDHGGLPCERQEKQRIAAVCWFSGSYQRLAHGI